jgi:hypothetical protein
MRTQALLPTGEKMNPSAPADAMYYDRGATAIVVRKQGASTLRVLTTFGSPDYYKVGDSISIHHDQTTRFLGDFVVVGVVCFATGRQTGDIPNQRIPHWVFK